MFAKIVGKLVIFPRIILNVNFTSKLTLMMINSYIARSFKSCLLTPFDPRVGTSGKKENKVTISNKIKKKAATTDNERYMQKVPWKRT